MQILITGKSGYLANSLKKYLEKSEKDKVELVSLRNRNTISITNNIDVLVHTSALVHEKESKYALQDYYYINRDLTASLAKKAKAAGVKQFIFISSMAVYSPLEECIDQNSGLEPLSYYGKSKLAAEEALISMESKDFQVTIIRPPMIYGPKAPGNYKKLRSFAKKTLVFPEVGNKRSMIYIENLCEFIFQVIKNTDRGIYHPQDSQYINTSLMVKEIANANRHMLFLSRLSGRIISIIFKKKSLYKKIFGNLYYNISFSNYRDNSYQKISFKDAIKSTENIENEKI